MPSRKRNKGKDRKAKKAENERMKVRSEWMEYVHWEECDHGCAMISDDQDQPAFAFMDTMFMSDSWTDAVELHQQQI